MSLPYDQSYWDKKIDGYSKEEWVKDPSPFARIVAPYLKPGEHILELGTGAGQDGLWFAWNGHLVTATDASDSYFPAIRKQLSGKDPELGERYELRVLDVTRPLEFEDSSLDAVYAHLVLHYFDDQTMRQIMAEISRVLKPGGLLACMVNTQTDDEYDKEQADENDIIVHRGIAKRFFTTDSPGQFMSDFDTILLDSKGKTPKDDAIGNSGMIQFIGRKHG